MIGLSEFNKKYWAGYYFPAHLLHILAVHFQSPIPHPIPLSVLVILSHMSFARRLFFQTMEPCGKTHLTKSFCGYLDNLGAKALVSPNGL